MFRHLHVKVNEGATHKLHVGLNILANNYVEYL
jgi:hypothetical protein